MLTRILVSPWSILTVVLGGCHSDLFERRGLVENEKHIPVAGVRILANCVDIYGSHSSRVKRRIEKISNDRGRFQFNPMEFPDCDRVYYTASKPGYVVVNEWDIQKTRMPGDITLFFLLVAKPNLRMYYIKTLFPGNEPKVFTQLNGKSIVYQEFNYRAVFTAFHCSRRVATTAEELQQLRSLYCPFLLELEATLPKEDRQHIESRPLGAICPYVMGARFREVVAHTFMVEPREVQEFCAKAD